MCLLGIDYGRRKVGLAIANGSMAAPREVIRYKDAKILSEKIRRIIEKEKIEKIIVGVAEGKIGEEAREFGQMLKVKFNLPVHFQDETLTTFEAQDLSLKAGIKRKKRKKLEDAYSAALILQAYLDLK